MPSQCPQGFKYCQMTGKYTLYLDGFNSIPLYANMDENCGALPPNYVRAPQNC